MAILTKNRLPVVQDGRTGNRTVNGALAKIFAGSVLTWDIASQKTIRKEAAGTDKFDGIAINQSEVDNDDLEVFESGVIWIPVADIAGGAAVAVNDVIYVVGTDNLYDDSTVDNAGTCTPWGLCSAIKGTIAKIEFDVRKAR